VKVDGVVRGTDSMKSPVTGRRGELLEYRFWDRIDTGDADNRRSQDRLLTFGRVGEALMIEVAEKVVLVPVNLALDVRFEGHWDPGMLPGLLPDAVVAAHPELDAFKEELRYDEKTLHSGQRVRLSGHIEPVANLDASIYRGGRGPAWDFVVRPDLSTFRVEEL
jgi:hypothetical protein